MKVFFHTNIPSPYRVDFFNALGQKCDLTVSFEMETAKDRDKKWTPDLFKHFHAVFLKGLKITNDASLCPGIIKLLNKKWDRIVICGYATPTDIIAIEYLRLINKPFYIEADGAQITGETTIMHNLKRHLISAAFGWFTSGKVTSEYMIHYGAKREKCYEYPFTSLNNDDLRCADLLRNEDKELLKQKLNVPERKVVLSVGQFIYRKGFDVLIAAAKDFPSDCGVYIIGGNVPNEYIEQVHKLQLNSIHFIPFQTKKNLANYYAVADIFVFPTRKDIWGLVINEAMSFGLPVVTTDQCVAGLELIQDEKNGFVVPADNIEALSESVNRVLSDEDLKKTMGWNNRQRINEYTITKMVERHLQVFNNQ